MRYHGVYKVNTKYRYKDLWEDGTPKSITTIWCIKVKKYVVINYHCENICIFLWETLRRTSSTITNNFLPFYWHHPYAYSSSIPSSQNAYSNRATIITLSKIQPSLMRKSPFCALTKATHTPSRMNIVYSIKPFTASDDTYSIDTTLSLVPSSTWGSLRSSTIPAYPWDWI